MSKISGRLIKKKQKKAGASPGTLVFSGKEQPQGSVWHCYHYNEQVYQHLQLATLHQLANLKQLSGTEEQQNVWLHLNGLNGIEPIEQLGQQFNLHPLTMEDILNPDHRPKVEAYDHYLFITCKLLSFEQSSCRVQSQQLSLILLPQQLISVLEQESPMFNSVVQRLEAGKRIRARGTDYLCYALLDTLVDHYFLALEACGDYCEDLENQLLTQPSKDTLTQLHQFKRELLLLRKAIRPVRELISQLLKDEGTLISKETQVFLRDVYDHLVHIMDSLETLREMASSLQELYLTSLSNRTNEVMKLLTMMASIFIPLTFIAGLYGMNFEYMPELSWRYGYPGILGIMLGCSLGLLWYFRRKGWW